MLYHSVCVRLIINLLPSNVSFVTSRAAIFYNFYIQSFKMICFSCKSNCKRTNIFEKKSCILSFEFSGHPAASSHFVVIITFCYQIFSFYSKILTTFYFVAKSNKKLQLCFNYHVLRQVTSNPHLHLLVITVV